MMKLVKRDLTVSAGRRAHLVTNGDRYFVVSSTVFSGVPETVAFSADKDGHVIDWGKDVAGGPDQRFSDVMKELEKKFPSAEKKSAVAHRTTVGRPPRTVGDTMGPLEGKLHLTRGQLRQLVHEATAMSCEGCGMPTEQCECSMEEGCYFPQDYASDLGRSIAERVLSMVSRLVEIGELDEEYEGFKKLKGQLAHQKGVHDPSALAASIGRKKYGKKKFQRAAAAGKKMHEEER